MEEIKGIGSSRPQYSLELPQSNHHAGIKGFKDYLQEFIREVDELQKQADTESSGLASGKTDNIHKAMITMEKADVSFRLMVEVRNRIMSAYNELIKMQV